jgi:elongation factor Ts
MSITATQVKELRDKTGAGMMECKKALGETEGDMEKAVTWLREKGIASASKKAGRATGEGLVGLLIKDDGTAGALAEVSCETDFVAKTEDFTGLVKLAAETALAQADQDPAAGGEKVAGVLAEKLKATIGKLGENMALPRAAALKVQGNGALGSYLHPDGKLAVLVELACGKADTVSKKEFKDLARDLAMQVAGHIPPAQVVRKEQIDAAFVAKEREIAVAQARETGKPEAILEKIAEGKVNKVLQEITLLEQVFVKEGKDKISEVVARVAKALGDELTVKRFVRLKVGESAE